MIDSNDRARIDEARQELHRIILDREMKDALLLVFANKQDIKGALTPSEVTEHLRLGQLKDRIWYVVPSCATNGEGLFEGLVCWDTLFDWSGGDFVVGGLANVLGRVGSRITSSHRRRNRNDGAGDGWKSTHNTLAGNILRIAFPPFCLGMLVELLYSILSFYFLPSLHTDHNLLSLF